MAIGEADSKEHRLRGLLSQPNDKGKYLLDYSVIGEADPKPLTRQVSIAPYDLFSTLSDFSFSMPGGWNDHDLAIFLESCWENIEDLRKQKVDDNTKWKRIAEAGAKKSLNPTLFTINSCMEVAQCIKSYLIYNDKRLSGNESLKNFHNDVMNLLPYFPPVTILGTFSTMNRTLANPEASIAEHVNEDDLLEKTLSQLILQYMPIIREGNPLIWEKLSKAVHDRIAFNTDVQLFLELTKRKIISLVRKEQDPQRKKDVFFQKAKKYMLEVFDYVAPLSVQKSEFLSPSEIDTLGANNGVDSNSTKIDSVGVNNEDNNTSKKRDITESAEGSSDPLISVEGDHVNPNLSCSNISSSKKLKQNSDFERVGDICEPKYSENSDNKLIENISSSKKFKKHSELERVDNISEPKNNENCKDKLIADIPTDLNNLIKVNKNDKSEESHREIPEKSLIETPKTLKEEVVSFVAEPLGSPPEEPIVSQVIIKPPKDKKERKVKKNDRPRPSRVLPPRTARPTGSLKVKHSFKAIQKTNDPENETEVIGQLSNIRRHRNLKEIQKLSNSVLKRIPEHKEKETSVRLVRKVTTTRKTILRRRTTLAHSESPANLLNSGRKPGVDPLSPHNKTFVNKSIFTEEKVTTVVEASSFLKKPIVRLVDFRKDSNFQYPFHSKCTVTTSGMSSNSNEVTVTKFEEEEISVASIPKRKQNLDGKNTKFKEKSLKPNNRRSNCGKSAPFQKVDKSKVVTVVNPYNYETHCEDSTEGSSRSRRSIRRHLVRRNESPEPSSPDSDQLDETSNPSTVVSDTQREESSLSLQVRTQHPGATVQTTEERPSSPYQFHLTKLMKEWDELHERKELGVESLSVEGILGHLDHNREYWFQKYYDLFSTRSVWRLQQMRTNSTSKKLEELKQLQNFYTEERLTAIKNEMNSLKHSL